MQEVIIPIPHHLPPELDPYADIIMLCLLACIGIFILSTIIIAIHISYYKLIQKKRHIRITHYSDQISDMIALLLSGEIPMIEAVVHISGEVKKEPWKRDVLLKIFQDLTNHFKGDQLLDIRTLFIATSLDETAIALAQKGSWHEKARAVRLIGKMKITKAIPVLQTLSNTNHPLLTSEVRAALTQLNDFSWIEIVKQNNSFVSDWEQLLIIEKLYNERHIEVPDCISLIKSENISLIRFGIRLSYLFNQFEAVPEMGKVLASTKDYRLLKIALKAMRFLGPDEARNDLILFLKEGDPILIADAMELLGTIGDEESIKQIKLFIGYKYAPLRLAGLQALHITGENPSEFEHIEDFEQMMAHVEDDKLSRT